MPRLETICMVLFNDVHHHLTFLSNRFKCLMFYVNLNFSQLFNAPV